MVGESEFLFAKMCADIEEANHFKIHVAKAKDLPPSWYDLVLRPEKFEQHINTLRENPYGMKD